MKHVPSQDLRIVPGFEMVDRLRAAKTWPTVELFGLPLVCAGRVEIARHIIARVASRQRSTFNFVNAHCVNVQSSDADYCEALLKSDLLLPDGVGIEIAARMCGRKLGDNLNGTDLFPQLCAEAEDEGVGIFFLGGKPGVADRTADWATSSFSELRVAGTQSGYFSCEEEDDVIDRINASRAGIVLVGFGVPLQEKWIQRNRHRLNAPVVMGVGGLFDYYSGRIPRAPQLVRTLKGEWTWRLAMEPRRMARRYLVGNASFLASSLLLAARANGILNRANAAAKRVMDFVIASLAIMALLPIFIATALAIRIEDKGPVLFRQIRIGIDGNPFEMVKFRSMFTDAEARRVALLAKSDREGTCFKMRDDPRITRTGRFIRRFSIDELPQLFNVLWGSMSLVGPRPALPSEVATYEGKQWGRLAGKPGITCTWQVKGRAEIPFERQAIMDRAYLKRADFWVDIKLLLCTPGAVLKGRGAY